MTQGNCIPKRWEKLDYFDPTDRFLKCPCYESCLSWASDRAWRGFTCRFCEMNPKEEEQPNERDNSKMPLV